MTDALSSHAAAAKQSADNILALLEVEHLCSPIEYRGEIVRRKQLEIAEEQRQRAESLKGRKCERCSAPATSM
jgi:hypothetical protein